MGQEKEHDCSQLEKPFLLLTLSFIEHIPIAKKMGTQDNAPPCYIYRISSGCAQL